MAIDRHHIPTIVWNAVCISASIMDVDPIEIFDQNRRRQVLRARQAAVWAIREVGHLSYPEIGKAMDKDHTTVMHAYQRFCEALKDGEPWAERVSSGLRDRLIWGIDKEWNATQKTMGDAAPEFDLIILKTVASGAFNISQISNSISIDKNRVSRVVDRLCRNQMLTCTYGSDENHPLSTMIRLTPTGAAHLAKSSPPKSCDNENLIR